MLISRLYDQDLWDSVLQSFPAPELAPLLGQLVENSWPGGQNEPGVPAPSSPRRGGTSTGLSVCWICRRGLFWSPPPRPEEFSATAGALQHVSEMLSAVKNLDKHKFGSGRFLFIFPSLVCLEKEPGHLAKGFDASIHNLPSLD